MTIRIAALSRRRLLDRLEAALTGLDVELHCTTDTQEFAASLAACEVAVLPVFEYDEALATAMRASARLRWMQLLTVGTERLRVVAPPPGVEVTTVGDSMAGPMAEHAFALLLALSRQLRTASVADTASHELRASIEPVAGRRLAIVGHGAVGRAIAARARAFGIHTTGLRRHPVPDGSADEVRGIDELHAVLPVSDFVVVALPLTPATRGLIGEEALQHCKPGAIVVNVSRGAVVDTDALTRALASGRLRAAGLDVTEPEPLPQGHPLRALPNVLLTPHIAAAGAEEAIASFVAGNVRRYLRGEPLAARYAPTS